MDDFIIWGMGKVGKKYVEKCISCGIKNIKLSDSDSKLWGTSFCGLEVQSPDDALIGGYGLIIISTGEQYFHEIKQQLIDAYDVNVMDIIRCNETILLSKDEVYDLGNLVFKNPINESAIIRSDKFYELIRMDCLNDLEAFFFTKKHSTIWKWLHYFEAYNHHFLKYRDKDMTILEIGVFRGGSLQMWRNYFQATGNKVTIFGIDIDPKCKCFEEDNIKILIGSQEDREFLRQVKEQIGKVDILIDDGGHTMNQQIVTMEELFDLVDDEGVYLCEDLHTSYMEEFGGEYKGNTMIEYSKHLIDILHSQYMPQGQMQNSIYAGRIKSIHYYDSMIFIEKKKKTTKGLSVELKI